MKKFIVQTVFAAAAAVFAADAAADVRLPQIFNHNMVLQRETAVPVWGWADPGEKITVSFAGQTAETAAGNDGKWKTALKPLQANAEPAVLTVKGKNEIKLENVLVGEVWICSGQSNMQWEIYRVDAAEREDAQKTAENPNLRLVQFQRGVWDSVPQETGVLQMSWTPSSAKAIQKFSGVGYFFGRKLQKELGVPVGLIDSSWGGTRIEPWTPPAGFESVPALKHLAEEAALKNPKSEAYKTFAAKTLTGYRTWLDNAEKQAAAGERIAAPPAFPNQILPYTNVQQPTVIYNKMIFPFVPFAVKGAVWYQGEGNVGEGMLYAEKMKALIQGWRTVFNNPELGFYYVQLAPFIYGGKPATLLPEIWEAQSAVEKLLPKTGQAVINDLVTNLKDIHPPRKLPVGERLAALALNRTYGKKDVVYASPEYDRHAVGKDSILVYFKNGWLKTRDGKSPDWFEIAGADGIFHKAEAVIQNGRAESVGGAVRLTSPNVPKPQAVRFAWDQTARPNLQNEAGLPLGAFRAGEISDRAVLDEFVPEAHTFQVVYRFDPTRPVLADNQTRFVYAADHSGSITGKIKRVGYFLLLTKDNKPHYVFAAMPPLDPDVKKLGVPVKGSGAGFQQAVKNVEILASNVPSVKTGKYAEGWAEFWDGDYSPENEKKVPGASNEKYDFGDKRDTVKSPGYGSMQLHIPSERLTVFAFNHFSDGATCDIGIGNNPDPKGHPDWTFSKNAGTYSGGMFLILAETE